MLIGFAALLPVYGISQDASRLCLTEALVMGRLHNDGCLALSIDRASYRGHLYTDKAPGMSVLEVPSAEAVRLQARRAWPMNSLRLWAIRVLSSGIAFLVCTFLVGRTAEGLAPGYGSLTMVSFALGTLMAPFAAANFDHVPAAALGFGAFLLAWSRRWLLAGIAAGFLVATEYEAAAITAIIAIYGAVRGRPSLVRYVCGTIPGIALLGAYDWGAFGAPWRLSYRYVTQEFATEQASGFFGIGLPHPHTALIVLAGSGGLLVVSPVIVAGAFGLRLVGRVLPLEAIVCAAVVLTYLILEAGYFLPYGGTSPGPRFLIPALPFAAIGLGPAFARLPRLITILATVSIVATIALTLTWSTPYAGDHTIWVDLYQLVVEPRSARLTHLLVANALNWIGLSRIAAAAVTSAVAAVALIVACTSIPEARRSRPAPE